MSKPIIIIKITEELTLNPLEKQERIRSIIRGLNEQLGYEYHVVAVPEYLNISVLNGLSFELSEDEINELKDKLLKEKE